MIEDPATLAPTLASLGWAAEQDTWCSLITHSNTANLSKGRIAQVSRGYSAVFTGGQAVLADSSSERSDAAKTPATGDFVVIATDEEGADIITHVAPRRTALQRRMPGRVPEPQILAANIDHVLVMHGLDRKVNLRRMERQLVVAFDSGAKPVVVLTKADFDQDQAGTRALLEPSCAGAEIITTSAKSGEGLDRLAQLFTQNKTSVMLGLSGIGKSTLVNVLSGGAVQLTNEVRVADRRGRHTTVSRDLIPLPSGGMIIDTPGIREIGLWQAHSGLAEAFPELTDAALECRFANCRHEQEPGCGIRERVDAGEVMPDRLDHWKTLLAELAEQDQQLADFDKRSESRQRAKAQDRQNKQRPKKRRR